ncbi:hypothetical protein [Shinella sp.]|uniref:hypothetical protein n=1 Tax=Shinella sp. TaxID=1870904 RepID=UPI0028A96491|nr:hypothetical protein [Shinella sp.]
MSKSIETPALPQTIAEAIADHEAKLAAWTATTINGELPTNTPEEKAAWAAEMHLVALPCHSLEEVKAKVEYLFYAPTVAAEGARDTAKTTGFHAFLGSLIGVAEAGE